MMTEEEAKKKVCPFRVIEALELECIASGCACWVWTDKGEIIGNECCEFEKAQWQGRCGMVKP